MTKKLFTFTTAVLMTFSLFGQKPMNIVLTGSKELDQKEIIDLRSAVPCQENDAGIIDVGLPVGFSNDGGGIVSFLCFGDQIPINQVGVPSVLGDPRPSSRGGVGFAIYDDRPTIDGPDLATIITDPTINRTSPLQIGPNPEDTLSQLSGIWVSPSADGVGNAVFTNDSTIQVAYNNGDPVQLWFAAITVDSLPVGFEPAGEDEPNGPCVSVATATAFSVVYLNPVEIVSTNIGVNPTGCQAEITVDGGFPEFDPAGNYTLIATLQSDPSIVDTITRSGKPNIPIVFTAPSPGIYDIEILDDKSCPTTTTLDLSGCTAVTLNVDNLNATPGQTNVCVNITVEDFVDIGIVAFSVNWDPAVLSYLDTDFHPQLVGAQEGPTETDQGILTVSWPPAFDPDGETIADGEALMTICFDVIGQIGDQSPVIISGNPTPIEFFTFNVDPIGVVLNSGQVNISPDNIFLDVEGLDPVCEGDFGSIIVTAAGGMGPYNIFIEDNNTGVRTGPIVYEVGMQNMTISDVVAGDYTIIAQDAAGEETTALVTIENPAGLGVRLVFNDPLCFGDTLNTLTAQVIVGGTIVSNPEGQFTFDWDTPFTPSIPLTGSTIQNVPLGRYSVTITDGNGCSDFTVQTIPSPAEITVPSVNVLITDATCSGAFDGSIVATAVGGTSQTGNYTYSWSNGFVETAPQSSNPGLDPGSYSVSVTDDNGCEQEISGFVVSANKVFTLTQDVTNVRCFGEGNGSAFTSLAVGPSAPNLPFSFIWTDESGNLMEADSITSDGQAGTSTIVGLTPGIYFLTAEETGTICGITDSIVITEPDSLDVTFLESTLETCTMGMGSMDATATIEVEGGTFPYFYEWTNPMLDVVSTDSAAIMLSSDTLVARVTDLNGCLDTLEVLVGSLPPPTITSIPTDRLNCSNETAGSLRVNVDPNGVTPVQFEWFSATGVKVGDGPTANNLTPGDYFVEILGDNECLAVGASSVTAPAPISVDSININNNPDCPGDQNGQFAVFVSGGTEPYTFTWSNNPGSPVPGNPIQFGFSAGTYDLTVTDANNCEPDVSTGVMIDPPSILVNFTGVQPTSCFNSLDGGAIATASYSDGMPGNFTFAWESNEVSSNTIISTASQLPRDSVRLLVDDGTCIDSFFVFVPSPPSIEIGVAITNITCNGDDDGGVELNVQGGTVTGDYGYNWATGETTRVITGLAEGTYEVEVSDDNGCTKTQFASIVEPPLLTLQVNPAFTEDVSCNGANDGIIQLLALGGNGNNVYTWSDDGGTEDLRENLPPGEYFVTVTDVNGCQADISHVVNEPGPILVTIMPPEAPICFGDPSQLVILDVTGGNATSLADYTYQVNNNNIDLPVTEPATVFPIINTYTITDMEGCTLTDTVTVPEAPRLDITFDPQIQVVELGDTLVMRPIITGVADRVLTYEWTPEGNLSAADVENPVLQGLLDDVNLRLTVTDNFGCTATNTVLVELDANRNVYVPNAFSPNGTGEVANEVFSVYACKGVSNIISARIFDRWGELLFENFDITPVTCDEDRPSIGTELWDGTSNGKEMSQGTYAYTIEIEFLDEVRLTYRGTFHLIR